MKKITILLAALLGAMAWTGCQNTLEQEAPVVPGEKPEALRDSVTLTIEAGKRVDTKALTLAPIMGVPFTPPSMVSFVPPYHPE